VAIVKCKECGGELSTKADACPKCGAKQKRSSGSGCLKVILVLFLAFVALAVIAPFVGDKGSTGNSNESTPTATPAAAADPKTKISPYVFDADEKSDFPKLAKKLGASWSRLQPTREAAALHVAANSKCDFVEVAEASDKSTKSNIVIFVDCRNGERMYVSESDLKAGGASKFQSDKVVDRASAIKACSDAAKSMTTHPELADMHIWTGSSFSANKTTGNAQVLLDFDASNAFGVKGKFTARCIFPANGEPPEITVHAR